MLCTAHVRPWSTHGAPHVGEALVDGAAMGMNWEAGDEHATTSETDGWLDEQGVLQLNVWIGIDGMVKWWQRTLFLFLRYQLVLAVGSWQLESWRHLFQCVID